MAWVKSKRAADGSIRWYLGYRDARGQEKSRPLGALTEAEARQEADVFTRDVEGREPTLRAVTGRQALAHFLRSLRVAKRSASTIAYYHKYLGDLVGAWRDVPPRRWSVRMLNDYVLRHPKWSASTIQKLLQTCRHLVRWASLVGVGIPDFTRGFERPKVRAVDKVPLTEEQVLAVCAAAIGHKYEVPIHLAVYTGLGWGDLKALQWNQVDIDAGWLKRRRCKSDTEIRMPLAAPLVAVLKRHRALSGPVCRTLPKENSSSLRTLRGVLERAGIDVEGALPRGHRGWHLLRHTFGTTLNASGADYATVGRLLGHKPGSPVTARYVHPGDAASLAAIQRMERALGGAK